MMRLTVLLLVCCLASCTSMMSKFSDMAVKVGDVADNVSVLSGQVTSGLEKVNAKIEEADTDGDGKVDFAELVAWVLVSVGGVGGVLGTALAKVNAKRSTSVATVHERINSLERALPPPGA